LASLSSRPILAPRKVTLTRKLPFWKITQKTFKSGQNKNKSLLVVTLFTTPAALARLFFVILGCEVARIWMKLSDDTQTLNTLLCTISLKRYQCDQTGWLFWILWPISFFLKMAFRLIFCKISKTGQQWKNSINSEVGFFSANRGNLLSPIFGLPIFNTEPLLTRSIRSHWSPSLQASHRAKSPHRWLCLYW